MLPSWHSSAPPEPQPHIGMGNAAGGSEALCRACPRQSLECLSTGYRDRPGALDTTRAPSPRAGGHAPPGIADVGSPHLAPQGQRQPLTHTATCTSVPCASRPAWAWHGPGRGLGPRVNFSAPMSGPHTGSSPLSPRPGVTQLRWAGRPAQWLSHLRAHSSFLSWLAPRQEGLSATTQHSLEADPPTSSSPCATSSRKPS